MWNIWVKTWNIIKRGYTYEWTSYKNEMNFDNEKKRIDLICWEIYYIGNYEYNVNFDMNIKEIIKKNWYR